jgi:two-component system OmpR family sensor kinase
VRRRVLAYLAFVAVASCALTVAVGVVLIRHRVADQRLHALRAQAAVLGLLGGAPRARGVGIHVYRLGVRRPRLAGPALARAVLLALPAPAASAGTIHIDGVALLYVAEPTAAGRIVLVRRAALQFAEWRGYLVVLALAGAGGALLAALLAVVLARRLTRPITALAAATRRLADGHGDVRVPVEGHDELAGLAQSFNAMSEQLTQAREAQGSFLASVGHELRTPLTSVRGYAEALADGAITPREGGAVIAAEARRLERLVSDLMDLARVGRAGFSVAREPVDLAAVTDAALTRHRVAAERLGVSLVDRGERGARGVGDFGRLLQATSNLIENALRLTPVGGTVWIAATPGRITVGDTGPGLAPDDLPRAFERFYLHDRYRADPERAVGSGLGLAIVAELVAAMGGSVSAANRSGGGARFTIALASPPPGTAPSGPPVAQAATARSPR